MVTGFVEPGKQNPKSIRKTKATKLTLQNSPSAQELRSLKAHQEVRMRAGLRAEVWGAVGRRQWSGELPEASPKSRQNSDSKSKTAQATSTRRPC